MNRRRRIYEGKAKILYEGPEPGTLIQFFKDDATAFNKKKHDVIDGKGVLNNRISEYLFTHLNKMGIPTLAIRVNDFLSGLFLGVGIQLVDFKLECGRLFEGDMMRIIIADEISPDSCRLWDVVTQEKMDKDRFRRDMGGLLEAYQEVARRLGIINENEPIRGTGPVLVK